MHISSIFLAGDKRAPEDAATSGGLLLRSLFNHSTERYLWITCMHVCTKMNTQHPLTASLICIRLLGAAKDGRRPEARGGAARWQARRGDGTFGWCVCVVNARACAYIRMRVWMRVCVCVYVRALGGAWACAQTRLCVRAKTRVRVFMCARVRMCVCVCVCVHVSAKDERETEALLGPNR